MSQENEEKTILHPRNRHRSRYDFTQLITCTPELADFVFINEHKIETVDFANPEAVKTLNKALLRFYYDIKLWDIPEGYLCPPIPGRADYLHYIADLLAEDNGGVIPKGKTIKVLDIGIGANCIYPIIGQKEYGWRFVGSDIDQYALNYAQLIIKSNAHLTKAVDLRLQNSAEHIFKYVVEPGDQFTVTICNPPFHASQEEADEAARTKLANLGLGAPGKPILNFGGQNAELWCKGGELAFIQQMIAESAEIPTKSKWFTTLVSKKEHLKSIYFELEKAKAIEIRTIDMSQGQKLSRIVAWRFV